MKLKRQVFNTLKSQSDCSGGRPSRSIMCTGRSQAQRQAYSAGRPRDRPTESTPLSGAGRSTGRSTDGLARSTGRSIGGTTVRNMTVAPVDRAVDRNGIFALSCCQRADLERGYIYAFSWVVLHKFLESKFFHLYKYLTASF